MTTHWHSPLRLRPLSRDEVRQLDQRAIHEFALPGLVLMENAGRGAATILHELIAPPPRTPPAPMPTPRPPVPASPQSGLSTLDSQLSTILICAGRGNNAGDGYVMARHLQLWGHTVAIASLCNPAQLTGDAATNYLIAARSGIPVTDSSSPDSLDRFRQTIAESSWLIDALLGTGAQGEVREPLRSAINLMNDSAKPIFAVDIPSGLDCDTGQPLGTAIRAAHTATFVAPKLGFSAPAASDYTGTVHVVDIGLPLKLLEPFLVPTP